MASGASSLFATAVPTNAAVPISDGSGTLNDWITSSGSGDVVGPVSATDNAVVRFDATTGKLIQNSTAILLDSGFLGLNTDPGAASFFVLKSGTPITPGASETVVYQNNANTSDSLNVLAIAGAGTGTAGYWMGDAAGFFQGGTLYRNTSDQLSFWAGGAESVFLSSTGNLGVGTSPGNTRLFILKSGTPVSTGASEVLVLQNTSGASDSMNFLGVAGASGSVGLFFGDTSNQFMGGINYLNSSDNLDVYANGANCARFQSDGTFRTNVTLTTGLSITTATKSFPMNINGTLVNVLAQ